MKFSVKSIYPISTSLRVTNYQADWESAAAGVEYLFMGDGSRNHRQITEGNYDFRDISFNLLSAKPQIGVSSGRYRLRNAVPI